MISGRGLVAERLGESEAKLGAARPIELLDSTIKRVL